MTKAEKIADQEMDPFDAADYLGKSPRTLADWRYYRRGPAYSKDDRGRVSYRRADLDAWRAEQVVLESTREVPEVDDEAVFEAWVAGRLD